MKRFLRITSYGVFQKDNCEKQDLIDVKEKRIDILLDLQEGKYFDAETNSWKEVQSI